MSNLSKKNRDLPEFSESMRDHYQGRSVLVAGADGLLGFALTQTLHALGADVTILTRRDESLAREFSTQVVFGDFEDPIVVQKAVIGQSAVFDCVGSMSATSSNLDAVTTFRQECLAHIAFFDACAKAEPSPVVVFPSSRLVYGVPEYLPVDERHPLRPTSNYGLAKLTVERFLELAYSTHGLRSRVFRLSNPYAPQHQIDQCRYNVISRFALACASGDDVQIYGDGTQLRDYVHVSDVVNAFLASGADQTSSHEIFNLGGPEPIAIRDAVQVFVDAVGEGAPAFVPWPKLSLEIETGDYFSDLGKLTRRYALPPFVSPRSGLRDLVLTYRQQYEVQRTNYA